MSLPRSADATDQYYMAVYLIFPIPETPSVFSNQPPLRSQMYPALTFTEVMINN